jgi:endonuclease/exonuclease/phosphatase family metal-dependent hydrolase
MSSKGQFSVVSWNIASWRIWKKDKDHNEESWDYRKEHLINALIDCKASFICLQEVRLLQLQDIKSALESIGYDFVSLSEHSGYIEAPERTNDTPMDDENERELLVIAFKSGRFTYQGCQASWLSKTPKIVSQLEGTSRPRACLMATFCEKGFPPFIISNTHYDQMGGFERFTNSYSIEIEEAEKYAGGINTVILCGDRNSFADTAEEKTQLKKIMYDTSRSKLSIVDSHDHLSGEYTSFIGFKKDPYRSKVTEDGELVGPCIDQILYSKNRSIKVLNWDCYVAQIGMQYHRSDVSKLEEHWFCSDHCMIRVEFCLTARK